MKSNRDRATNRRIQRKARLQPTRYPVTTLELVLFLILVLTFIVIAILSSLPSGYEPHL
jgi:hypothetical protein